MKLLIMKRIVLLSMAIVLTVVSVMSQGVSNRLVVESVEGVPFVLRVDGFARNKKPQEKVVVDKLYSTVVRISVEFADSAYAAVHNYEVVLTRKSANDADSMMKGYEAYYKVKPGKKHSKVSRVSIKPVTPYSGKRYVPVIPDQVKKAKKRR